MSNIRRRPARSRLATLVLALLGAMLAGTLTVVGAAPAQAGVDGNIVVTSERPGTARVKGSIRWFRQLMEQPPEALQLEISMPGNNRMVELFPTVRYPDHVQFDVDMTLTLPDLGPNARTIPYDIRGRFQPYSGQNQDFRAWGEVTVQTTHPYGVVDSVTSTSHRTVTITGWAGDFDRPAAPTEIHIYVGGDWTTPGVETHTVHTGIARPDVQEVYGFVNSGFSVTVPTAKSGNQQVTVHAINHADTGGQHRMIGQATVDVVVDTRAPLTTITSAPKTATPDDTVTVTFSADEPNSTFQCRWDEATWEPCSGSKSVKLTPGNHMISVRATDAAGNTGPVATWVVSISQPATQPPIGTPGAPGTPGSPGASPSVDAQAVKRKSRLRVDVAPDSATTNYRVLVQRKVRGKWRTVKRTRTRGDADTVVVNLRRGRYRAVVPRGKHGPRMTSGTVRLRR